MGRMRITHQSSAVRLDTGPTTMSETPVFLDGLPDRVLQRIAHNIEESPLLFVCPFLADLRSSRHVSHTTVLYSACTRYCAVRVLVARMFG
jgi:hypothetical protein